VPVSALVRRPRLWRVPLALALRELALRELALREPARPVPLPFLRAAQVFPSKSALSRAAAMLLLLLARPRHHPAAPAVHRS